MIRNNIYNIYIALLLMLLLGGTNAWGQTVIHSLSDITDQYGNYILASDFSTTGTPKVNGTGATIGTKEKQFMGTLDGQLVPITGTWNKPLFTYSKDATFKNIIIENVGISDPKDNANASASAGALVSNATGATRIYNCGVNGGSIGAASNKNAGGLVGNLEETSRVINCYSYANIISGKNVGGIVGFNSTNGTTTTAANINTMVMNCMFYGDITGGTTVSPVYGGTNINNNNGGLNTFNYYAYDKLKTKSISNNKYNCALAVEDKYLNRFEFYRLLLNSNKKLAAFYATGSVDNANQMAKWVLETADRTNPNPMPYPILKAQGYYPSIINPDIANAPDSATVGRNKGGKLGKTLSVTISGVGSNYPEGASITTGSLTLQRTDKDEDRFNFNYDKVQLPYYNDVGTGNYTGNRVVTGWKIIAIDAVTGDPYNSGNYDYTKTYSSNKAYFDYSNYNFADRKSSNKDLYSVSGRVFSQGAYFDVPYGVTSITIEPYWGKACYIADPNYDVVYYKNKEDYDTKQNVTQTGTQVTVGTTLFDGQKVETSITRALDYIDNETDGLGGLGSTVYDNALVLVGNYHLNTVPLNGDRPFTMMSVDADNDHEPDYSLIYHHKNRSNITPIRFDFLNIPGTAQAQKPNGATLICNFTIFKTRGWFEVTNTAIVYSSQLEYENGDLGKDDQGQSITKINAPLILLGGIFDQFVSTQSSSVNGKTIYIHVGSNVWINSFGLGTHSDGKQSTPHVPVSVTGGEYEGFYLTGTYNQDATPREDNAECYISGGHFSEVAGASQEQIKGNVRWQIYDADIDYFFGGGINAANPITGNIKVDIMNSHVGTYCGGPKFGDMGQKNVKIASTKLNYKPDADRTVETNATNCTFGSFFGAGYGGNSISRKKYYDASGSPTWSTLEGYYTTDKGYYFDGSTTASSQISGKDYGKKGPGVATDFDYEFFVWSSGTTGVRLFVKFASFSLAQCNDVESNLKKCIIQNNFYGGGNLGKVTGTATSVLDDCEVHGSVYGGGYSASLPTVEVRNGGFTTNPKFNDKSGMFEPGVFSGTTTFTWQNATEAGVTLADGELGSDISNSILYTDVNLTTLGQVKNSNLIIRGSTTIDGSVYGGGALASMETSGETKVNLFGGTINGDVYGGGQGRLPGTKDEHNKELPEVKALVGNANVNLNGIDYSTDEATRTLYTSWGLESASTNAPYVVPDNNKGCVVKGNIFGCNNLNGTPKGTATVHIYKTQNVDATRITNPAEGEKTAKVKGRYDVTAVYGGGNLAAYEPDATLTTGTDAEKEASKPAATVIIDGCDRTSIQYVYGGGNAASTPATNVAVNGTFEVMEVFGGGNGKDDIVVNNKTKPNPGANVGFYDYSAVEDTYPTKENRQEESFTSNYVYGSGKAAVNIFGGKIHRVFGGSNTKGNVRQTAVTMLDERSSCDFLVDEAYGGGKSAPMDAKAQLLMACIPGLKQAYGGAEAADIMGDVELNITNGTFDRVFGGNNISGTIRGAITVNVEEVGCRPIKIGELYGGGNQAGYSVYGYKQVTEGEGDETVTRWIAIEDASDPEALTGDNVYADPQVNVMSFTSIGNIYGGGYGSGATMVGNPTVNVNVAYGRYYNDDESVVGIDAETPNHYPIPSHAKGKMGAINNIFGGGNAAKVIGNTYLNIATLEEVYVVKEVTGNTLPDGCYKRNNDGTYTAATGTAEEGTTYYEKKNVQGVDIRGNVFGGGNQAEVTGNSKVKIGKKEESE